MIRKSTTNKSSNCHQHSNLWRNCTSFRALKQIHTLMVVNGFNSSQHALRELSYASAIALPSAIQSVHQLFDQISEADIFMWNTMLRGSGQSSKPSVTMPLCLLNMVPKRDVVTWNAMISGYVLGNEYQRAVEMHQGMRSAGEYPDEVTMVSLLSACAESDALDVGEKLHSSILDVILILGS